MAAIVRVKRSRDEEAAESLNFLYKRFKSGLSADDTPMDEVRSVFKYAGTLNAKGDEVATKFVQKAIKKEKLMNEYKRHNLDLTTKRNDEQKKMTSAARCKIVAKKRAIDFKGLEIEDQTTIEDVDNESRKQYLLYDVEKEHEATGKKFDPLPSCVVVGDDAIACNGVPMIREKVTKTSSFEDPSFVYDIYYMNSANFDYRTLENVLAVELVREEMMHSHPDYQLKEAEELEDNEDDEDNWRNDYPDEDPLYYETMDDNNRYDGKMMNYDDNDDVELGFNDFEERLRIRCHDESSPETTDDDDDKFEAVCKLEMDSLKYDMPQLLHDAYQKIKDERANRSTH